MDQPTDIAARIARLEESVLFAERAAEQAAAVAAEAHQRADGLAHRLAALEAALAAKDEGGVEDEDSPAPDAAP